MSYSDDVATARAAGHNISRQQSVNTDTLILLAGASPYTTLTTLTTDWDLSRRDFQDFAEGPRYYKLYIEDLDGSRLAHLKNMTAVRIKGVVFKFVGKDSLIGAVPSYEFKVQATGERV
jgi:hypothetical protein